MKMQKWATNCELLRDKFQQAGETVSTETSITKVLGIFWNYNEDTVSVKFDSVTEVINEGDSTKRTVLQASSRIFYPLGWLAPFTIRVNVLFQKIWMHGLDWESVLPETLKVEWDKWIAELQDISDFRISRNQLATIGPHVPQLLIFTDASPCAYGAVTYLRVIDSSGKIVIQQLLAKVRVAPIKRLTLPCLELVGTLLGARLLKLLRDTVPHENLEYFCWTDSRICLSWLQSTPTKCKPFVCNRVIEIQGLTETSHWKHCSGKTNTADLVTRGISAQNLCTNNLWWHGPEWLAGPQEAWPQSDVISDESPDVLSEARSHEEATVLACHCSPEEPLFDIHKRSRWIRVTRITAWITRMVHNCRDHSSQRVIGPLTAPEIKEAEFIWMRSAQADTFEFEMTTLSADKPLHTASRIRDLHPFLDHHGILRIKTRLENVKASANALCPILLPADHRITYLIPDSLMITALRL